MKKLVFFLLTVSMITAVNAQVPAQLNYQGVARRFNGNPITEQTISLRLTIHNLTAAGAVVYQETRSVLTNAFGLFNVAIGSPGATSVTGSVATVNWATGNKFLQVEMDPDGGSSFLDMGTSQLLSVPYALAAGVATPIGAAGGDLTGTYPNPTVAKIRGVNVTSGAPTTNYLLGFDGTNWTPTNLATHPANYWRASGSNIYNANSGNVGVGTTTPSQKLEVNGSLKTSGFIMPTGAGLGKVLMSDAGGTGSWSSNITATKLALPYKDSASSETAHIFHIIQTSTTSMTNALYGVTRSTAAFASAVGGQVSSLSAGGFSSAVRGDNQSTTGLGIGVWGSQNGSGWGVYGTSPHGVGVYGASTTYLGVFGSSSANSGVYGNSNANGGYLGGVFGYSAAFNGNGIFGYTTRALGYGALGISDSSIGVFGQTGAATFAATANDGAGVYANATSGGTGLYSKSFTGIAGKFENLNPSNSSTTLDVESVGTGRAIVARSNFPGYVNAGVIDALTTTFGGNAVYGRATRYGAWGVYGLSDSSAGVAGVGYRAGSVGVYGLGWMGGAGQFVIDNTFANSSNAVEISNTQSGKSLNVLQTGTGMAIYANSEQNTIVKLENTNASNGFTSLDVQSLGTGRAIAARSNMGGYVNGGVIDGLTTTVGGNAVYGRGFRYGAWGVYGLSDSSAGVAGVGYRAGSVGVYGLGWMGSAGQFVVDNTFLNTSNTVEISNTQAGKGLNVMQTGTGIGIYANSEANMSAKFESTNPSNTTTILDVGSLGTGRAIAARSNMGGYVNGGVIDGLTTTVGGNAVYGRGFRYGAWGVYGLSDSSAGVAGVGYRAGSVGVYGLGWMGNAGQFVIDNTFANSSNTVEVSNSQSGKAVNIVQSGNGIGLYSRAQNNHAAWFENTNASNGNAVIYSQTNGSGYAVYGYSEKNHAIVGVSTNAGVGSAGVYGLNQSADGNGLIGWGTRVNDWGLAAHSDSSIGVFSESQYSNAGYFSTYGTTTNVPALYARTNGLSAAASFAVTNSSNVADAVTITRVGEGRSLLVDGAAFNNLMYFYNPAGTGKSTARFEGRSGIAVYGHAGGSFEHTFGGRVGVGVYGTADSVGSTFNYGIVGSASGGTLENAGVAGWIGSTTGSNVNAAIYGLDFSIAAQPHFAGLFNGNVQVTGTLSKGAGTFKIDHPQDPLNKYLVHSFVESPDMMNVYNGNIVTDNNGKAVVDLPSYFEAENIDFKYQLTVIGQFAQAIIGDEIKNNQFTILTDKPNVKVSWQVTGVRNDKFAQQNRIVPEVEKKGNEKGRYLYPELYGQPKENGITFIKAGAPTYRGEISTGKQTSGKNDQQEQVNTMVEQKRNQLSQHLPLVQHPVGNNASGEKSTMQQTGEKAKMLSTVVTTPSNNSSKQQKEQKSDAQTEKGKKLTETINDNQEASRTVETKKALQPNEKTKQLSQQVSSSGNDQNKQDKKQGVDATEKKNLSKPTIKLPAEQDQGGGKKTQ